MKEDIREKLKRLRIKLACRLISFAFRIMPQGCRNREFLKQAIRDGDIKLQSNN